MTKPTLPAQLVQRDRERLKGYQELLDFYHGKHWEGLSLIHI